MKRLLSLAMLIAFVLLATSPATAQTQEEIEAAQAAKNADMNAYWHGLIEEQAPISCVLTDEHGAEFMISEINVAENPEFGAFCVWLWEACSIPVFYTPPQQ